MSEQILEVLSDLATRSADNYDNGVMSFVSSVLGTVVLCDNSPPPIKFVNESSSIIHPRVVYTGI